MISKKDYIFCFFTNLIIFFFFLHTLNYPWKHFDEQIIYKETLLPAPDSFLQIIDYLHYLGPNNYIEASNPFYSIIYSIRRTNVPFDLLIFWLFKKSALVYHIFSLTLHILNCFICFLIINKTSLLSASKISNTNRLILVSLLTLLFGLNPLNIESILFASNFGALITYLFCLLFLLYYISLNHHVTNASSGLSLRHSLLLFLLYLFPLFLNEYSVTLPVILFLYLFSSYLFYNQKAKYKDAILFTFKRILPLLLALGIFIISFLLPPVNKIPQENNLLITFERIFWLSPQIFFHFIKLILFPIKLSIDQTDLVKISSSLFDSYAVFCSLFMYTLIILSLISLFFIKRKFFYYFFITFFLFFLSLLPFLHIISPIYNLASERYLYLPLFFLIFGLSHILFLIIRKSLSWQSSTMVLLFFTVCIFSTRSYMRTSDWKDSVSLFTSAFKEAKSDLIRGLRLQMLGGVLLSDYKDIESQKKGNKFIIEGAVILERSLSKLENEKNQCKEKLPQIIKAYGLDPKSRQAKTAYLLTFTKLGLEGNIKSAYEFFKPYMQDLSVMDTQILDLYLGLLFATNNLDEAEKLLNYGLKNRPSPTLFIALSELYKRKYNDLSKVEVFLKESFKYFPYDARTLESLKNFYLHTKKLDDYALFSYLYGLRIHSKDSLLDAYRVYTSLYNQKMANKVMESVKLLTNTKTT